MDAENMICMREYIVCTSENSSRPKDNPATHVSLVDERKSLRERPIHELRDIATALGITIPPRANRSVLAKRIVKARAEKSVLIRDETTM